MKVSITYGFGFNVESVTIDKFFDFLINHLATITRLSDKHSSNLRERLSNIIDLRESKTFNTETTRLDEYGFTNGFYEKLCAAFEEIVDSKSYSYRSMISEIIKTETGIENICFETGEDSSGVEHETIMFIETYPWERNTYEKDLTHGDLFDLLKTYTDELGISDTNSPTYKESIYFDEPRY